MYNELMSGITQKEIDELPELKEKVVLYGGTDGPHFVIDLKGITWEIGLYKGKKWKRNVDIRSIR